MRGGSEGRAALAVMTGAALLGLSPLAVRLSELGPQATNFWRFVFALPILGLFALRADPKPSRRAVGLLLIAGLLFGLELGLWAAALGFTTVVNATLLSNLTPLAAALFGWLVLKERLRGPTLAGGAVALAGALVLAFARARGGHGPGDGSLGWLGDLLGFSSAFGYAAYLIIVRTLGGRVGAGAMVFWATLGAAGFSACAALLRGESLIADNWLAWALLVGNGVVVQAGGQGLIAYGVARLPISISTILLWIQPLAAAVLSWIVFDEALTPLALLGAGFILGGVWVVQRMRAAPGAEAKA